MKDTQLYSQILGIQKPWKATSVNVSLEDDEVEVLVQHGGGKLVCPKCGQICPGYTSGLDAAGQCGGGAFAAELECVDGIMQRADRRGLSRRKAWRRSA